MACPTAHKGGELELGPLQCSPRPLQCARVSRSKGHICLSLCPGRVTCSLRVTFPHLLPSSHRPAEPVSFPSSARGTGTPTPTLHSKLQEGSRAASRLEDLAPPAPRAAGAGPLPPAGVGWGVELPTPPRAASPELCGHFQLGPWLVPAFILPLSQKHNSLGISCSPQSAEVIRTNDSP